MCARQRPKSSMARVDSSSLCTWPGNSGSRGGSIRGDSRIAAVRLKDWIPEARRTEREDPFSVISAI